MPEHCIAMTTVGSHAQAGQLARQLVEERLAACVQIVPVRSVYRWQGDITEDDEQLLLIKTRTDRYRQLEALIGDCHPYDVPEIVQLPLVAGFAPYLGWIDDSTAG